MAENRLARYAHKSEVPVYRDEATCLPRTIGPFWIQASDGNFVVVSIVGDQTKRLGEAGDFFGAFRIMLDRYEAWWRANCDPQVYFIGERAEKGASVKIGYALNVKARLASLQTASPTPIRLLATTPGGKEVERSYHRKFKALKCRGEWFMIDDRILAEIARLTDSPQP